MSMAQGGTSRPVENDALIESSFRRLLSSIESEREKIRSMWQQIEQERDTTTQELEKLKSDTEDWCFRERQKIDGEWKNLEELHEKMSALYPDSTDMLAINCSGQIFQIPRATLRAVEGSHLETMFTKEYISQIPKDGEGRFLLDFNPRCFELIVEYLWNKRLDPNAPLPLVPVEQQANMDILAGALGLRKFLPENKISPIHSTSLAVRGNIIEATHQGWQCVSAERALILSKPTYFEVTIDRNPDPKGGLAIGLMGHVPSGNEIHTVRQTDAVLYNSNNGLVGDAMGADDVVKGVQFREGSMVGMKYDPAARTIHVYFNRSSIGSVALKQEKIDKMRTLYPVFALYVPEQKINVNFKAEIPRG